MEKNKRMIPFTSSPRSSFYQWLVSSLLLLSGVQTEAQKFTDVSDQAGINHYFEVFEGTFGAGATVFDFDNDGYEDVFLAGGKREDALYHNNRDGTFTDVYLHSGLKTGIKFVTQGAISADVDKDGWRDLFITTITTLDKPYVIPRAMNLLFLNNGDKTFRNATKDFGLDKLLSFSTGACFGDVNKDGYPDIYVGNYFQEYSGGLNIMSDNMIVSSNRQAKGYLLINHRGNYFTNEYTAYGLEHKGFGFGGVFSDFDRDGDLDLLVNNDFGYKSTPNFLYRNEYPEERFYDATEELAMKLKINAMGIAVGDYNNDGWMDYFVTNIRTNRFMVNQGKGKPFIDKTEELGTAFSFIKDLYGKFLPVSWGTNFADFDNDTDLDLFVSNGSLNPNVEPNPDYYLENREGKYTQLASEKGLANREIGRGSVVFDYDNDGDQDLLVVHQKGVASGFPEPPRTRLFRNNSDSLQMNWTEIELVGMASDKNAIGSRITVVKGDLRMVREIDGGSSHLSQNSTIAHFGLGNNITIDTIKVEWMGSGGVQLLLDQKANHRITITEINKPGWHISPYWLTLLISSVIFISSYSIRKYSLNRKNIQNLPL
jgi:enediyne biosynthesis protein E4